MKKVYEHPKVIVQEFTPNEYVAACYSLYCEVSGDNLSFTGDQWFNTDVTWGGKKVTADHQLHGKPCAEKSSYNQENGTFYENGKESKIDNVDIGSKVDENKYYATWGSDDVNGTGYYKHYGWAVLDDVNRPNHS